MVGIVGIVWFLRVLEYKDQKKLDRVGPVDN